MFYVARKDFAAEHTALVKAVLAAFAELRDWAVHNPEEAARLTAASSGIGYDALLVTEKRHAYGLRPRPGAALGVLIEKGHPRNVALAAEVNVSRCVPILRDGCFSGG